MTPDKTPTDAEILALLAEKKPMPSLVFLAKDDAKLADVQAAVVAIVRVGLAKWGSPVVAGEPTVKYVPVDSKLKDKSWNHPNDDELRTEACREALRDRGDDRGQGLDGYWKWGFAAGFNAALSTTPQLT